MSGDASACFGFLGPASFTYFPSHFEEIRRVPCEPVARF
jgi:hypothetical protein